MNQPPDPTRPERHARRCRRGVDGRDEAGKHADRAPPNTHLLRRDRRGDERWMSQQQVEPTDRRGEVIHIAVKSREDEAPDRCEKPTKAPSRPLRIFGFLA